MTYKETLDWMFAQLPMYQLKGKTAFNGRLENIISLSEHLGNPEKKFKSIHVAGTNGKGSSSHILASILQEAGYKTGLYTSPHLKDFRERIKVNGKLADKDFVVDFISDNKNFLIKNGLSFFEMTVGMAFDFFAREEVEIAVIEVGLGGRLDSTNIITPEVSLITNIGYDHLDMLGDTLQKIAIEKAGIIKENVPVVISEFQEEVADTFRTIAQEKNAKIIFAEKEIEKKYKTSLLGNYQSKNVKGAIATIKELIGFEVSGEHIDLGLQHVIENTGLMGRWQILQERPTIICDTAHNHEGLSLVLGQIQKQSYSKLHIVLGFVQDKNLDLVLPLFPKDADYYFARPDIPRGLDVSILQTGASRYNLVGEDYDSIKDALKAAKKEADPSDLIFIGGSTFVVAEVI
ncbi:MAG: bifunctional folylpolyglutamate synthase/dihydrofolate synthase [Aurantibacter sp.]